MLARIMALLESGTTQAISRDSGAWASDGLVLFVILLVVLVSLTWRQLRNAPRWMVWALGGIVAGGALVRLWLAPLTALGASPFSQTDVATQALFCGPGLATLQTRWGEPLHLTDVTAATTFAFSVLTPLAAFACGRALTRRTAIGLAAAAFVAALPMHIRFGLSDVSLISSVVLTALTVALACIAIDDKKRAWRYAAFVLLPIAAAGAVLVRPLGALILGIVIVIALYQRRGSAPLLRRLIVAAIAAAVALGAFVASPEFLGLGPATAGGMMDPLLVLRALAVAANPLENTLINPLFTPLVLLVLAVLGAIVLWEAERKLAITLAGWLVLFWVWHAYTSPTNIYTQSRDHLHLVVPFLLLSATGLCALAQGLRARVRRVAIPAVVLLVAVSPAVHARFIRDVNFNVQREYDFVREASAAVPEDCTVLEHAEPGHEGARFRRVGTVLSNWQVVSEYRVVPINAAGSPSGADALGVESGDHPLTPEALAILKAPPSCLYYFEGLPCFANTSPGDAIAPACAAIREALRLEPIARTTVENRPYDWAADDGLPEGTDSLGYTLYRASPLEPPPRP